MANYGGYGEAPQCLVAIGDVDETSEQVGAVSPERREAVGAALEQLAEAALDDVVDYDSEY